MAIARSFLDEGWRMVIADRAQGNLDNARASESVISVLADFRRIDCVTFGPAGLCACWRDF
jgi:ABC-type ATPase involved in cell division